MTRTTPQAPRDTVTDPRTVASYLIADAFDLHVRAQGWAQREGRRLALADLVAMRGASS